MPIKTATNSKTGDRVAFIGGAWRQIQKSATGPGGAKAYFVNGAWFYDSAPAQGAKQPTAAPEAVETAPVPTKLTPMEAAEESVKAGAIRPEFVSAVEANLNAMPKAERDVALKELVQREDATGRAARLIERRYAEYDKTAELPTLRKIADPRLEARTEKFIGADQGLELAQKLAQQEIMEGQPLPRALFGASARPDEVGARAREAAAKQAEELKDAGFVRRVGAEMRGRATQSGLGFIQFFGDVTGQKSLSRRALAAGRVEEAKQEAIPKGEGPFEQSAQQAIASFATQAPTLVLGAMTGTAAPVLAQAAIEVFGTEYNQGRRAGLSPGKATTRASLIGGAEIAFERFGLEGQFKVLKESLKNVPNDQLAGILAKTFVQELPAEQATSATQFLIDKLPELGLQPDAGWKEFFESQAETLRQTLIQTTATTGAVYGLGKGAEALQERAMVNQMTGRFKALGLPDADARVAAKQSVADAIKAAKAAKAEPKKPEPTAPPPPERVEPALGEVPTVPTREPALGKLPSEREVERENRIAQVAEILEQRGIRPEDAKSIATRRILEEDAAERNEMEARLADLTQDFVMNGFPPEEAKARAKARLMEVGEYYEQDEIVREPEPVGVRGRTPISLLSAGEGADAGVAEGVERGGVGGVGEAVGDVGRAEGAEPPTLTEAVEAAPAPEVETPEVPPAPEERSVEATPDAIKDSLPTDVKQQVLNQDDDPTIETSAVFAPPTEPTLVNRRTEKDLPATGIKGFPISGGTSEGDITTPIKRKKKFDEVNYQETKPAFTQDLSAAISAAYPATTLGRIAVLDGMANWAGAHFNGGVAIRTTYGSGLTENAEVVAHELGHAAHSLLGDKLNKNEKARSELAAIENFLYPGLRDTVAAATGKYDNKFFNYLLSPEELIAEFNVQRLGNPEQAMKIAPTVTKLLKSVDKNSGLVKKRKTIPTGYGFAQQVNGWFSPNGEHALDPKTYTVFQQALNYAKGEKKTKTPKDPTKAVKLLEETQARGERLTVFSEELLAELYAGKYGDEVKNSAKAAELYDRLAENTTSTSSKQTFTEKANALRGQVPTKETIDVDGVQRPTTNSEGRPIHPSEEGVRNFWRWFGNSKVVDAEGRPLVVYHGTVHGPQSKSKLGSEAISEFSVEGLGKTKGAGAFFSSSPAVAGTYAGKQAGSVVYPVYLRLLDPVELDANGKHWGSLAEATVLVDGAPSEMTAQQLFGPMSHTDTIGRALDKSKFDSAVINNVVDIGPRARIKPEQAVGVVYVVKDPAQVKSAVGNVGEYSDNPSIIANITNNVPPALPPKDERRKPSLLRAARRLEAQKQKGWINDQDVAAGIEEALAQVEIFEQEKTPAERKRGMAHIKKRLWEAVARGDLAENEVRFAEWLIDQNPNLVAELGISIVKPPEDGSYRGKYDEAEAIIYLVKLMATDGTAVHEILHHTERMLPSDIRRAILKEWAKRLSRARRDAKGSAENEFFDKLFDFHFSDKPIAEKRAQLEAALNLIRNGTLPYDFYQYVNPSEFWAVNGTRILQGRYDAIKGGRLSRLKAWLREFGQKLKSLLGLSSDAPIVRAIDQLVKGESEELAATMLGAAKAPAEAGESLYASLGRTPTELLSITPPTKRAAPPPPITEEQRELDERVIAAKRKFAQSKAGEETAKGLSAMQALREPRLVWPAFNRLYRRLNTKRRGVVLSGVTTDFLTYGAGKEIPELANTVKLLQEKTGLTQTLLESGGKLTNRMYEVFKKDRTLEPKFSQLMYEATLSGYDPADKKLAFRNKALDDQYKALGEAGQKLYVELRDYYSDMADYYMQLLDDQIQALRISPESKQLLLLQLRKTYESGNRIRPYFPLIRRGQYWLAVGSGAAREFYLFETMGERDAALDELVSKRYPNANLADARAEMLDRGKVEIGNNVADLRAASLTKGDGHDPGALLRELFSVIDGQSGTDADIKESLKDSLYQLYLQTLPDQSFRKQFLGRKFGGRAGFSTDVLRNTSQSIIRMSIQLARVKYAPLMRNSISQARDSIVGREDLTPYVDEMAERVRSELAPPENSAGMAVAKWLNKGAFIYYMSSWSSALLQPLSLFITGWPVLTRYGVARGTKELANTLALWNTLGVFSKDADGVVSLKAPSIEYSSSLSKQERKAVRAMKLRGITQSTYTSALYDYNAAPTEDFDSTKGKVSRGIDLAIGGLMHTTERITRELMFLAAFRLNIQAGKKFDEAVDQAVLDTIEALNDYSQHSKPPILKGVPGRIMLQFRMYPLHMTLFLLKNFKEMLPLLNKQGKAEAAKKFFGTLGMTFAFAGAAGLPGFSAVMGLLGWAWKELGEDDEELPEDMRTLDFETWWRESYIPDLLGEVKFMDKDVADIIERGPLSVFTGLDFSTRLGLNDMWFRDIKETATTRESALAMAAEYGGPSLAMVLSFADAYDALMIGDTQKFAEKMSPALVRNLLVAKKYAEEGAKGPKGESLLDPDKITTGELIGQSIGFRPDILADTQQAAFKLYSLEQRIENKRNLIMRRLNFAFQKRNIPEFKRIINEEVNKGFNRDFPTYAITGSSILQSIQAKEEQRARSIAGVPLSKENAALFVDILRDLDRKLKREEPTVTVTRGKND